MKNKYKILVSVLAIFFVFAFSGFSRGVPKTNDIGPGGGAGGFSLFPDPQTVDQIIHNKGNIVTTIDNWGYIGGYSYYGLPSGEWPRNSGHSYLAEIKYWMGAITAAGDTLIANSYDDFQAIPSSIDGSDEYKILLSTDSTRYYGYDLSDTIGSGNGNPANGWRVWDSETAQWIYNSNYNVLSTSFAPGGPTSLQESHYIFNDEAQGTLLGLEITQTILQWNYCYNEDFMFVVLDIYNSSTENYTDFAFGLYVDLDLGGNDGQGENGRLDDKVAFDSTENLAWNYDVKGYDDGWGGNNPEGRTGLMGTKYLETPDNLGMTSFRTDDWAIITGINDAERFNIITTNQFDTSLPPTDQFYIQATKGINLTAGKTVRVVFALIAGEDETEFRANADLAQQLYDNFYVGPQPPATPVLTAKASDTKVYLSWTDTSEVGLDPLTLVNDFSGYKLYRSEDQGKTWGEAIYKTNNNCLDLDYTTIATYYVVSPGDPIPHNFIDTGLYNGVDYWYCLAALDIGDSATGVDPLQSGFGVAGEVSNIIEVRPRDNPAGYFDAAGTVEHLYSGNELPSEGTVYPIAFSDSALTGNTYNVVFEDQPDATYWHLINATTGDTALAGQTKTGGDPGLFEIADGLRVVVTNVDHVPVSIQQTGFGSTDTTLVVPASVFYGSTTDFFFGEFYGDAKFRSTFEIRYTGENTLGGAINDGTYIYPIPFEFWNTTTNQRVSASLYDFGIDGVWDPYDLLIIVDYPYDSTVDIYTTPAWPVEFSWMFGIDNTIFTPSVGDILTIDGPQLNGPDDVFTFKVDAVDGNLATAAMKDIKVVPNPYFAGYDALIENSPGETVLEFHDLPGICTIRIYTLAGDLVETLEHNSGDGVERWDLLSSGARLIASGTYLYHVESEFGEFIGRFAVVK